MLVIDINERSTPLIPKVDDGGKFHALFAGLELAAIPFVGPWGLFASFDGKCLEEDLAGLEGRILWRSSTGVAFGLPGGADGEQGQDPEE